MFKACKSSDIVNVYRLYDTRSLRLPETDPHYSFILQIGTRLTFSLPDFRRHLSSVFFFCFCFFVFLLLFFSNYHLERSLYVMLKFEYQIA